MIQQKIAITPWKLEKEYIKKYDYWSYSFPEVMKIREKSQDVIIYFIPNNYREEKKQSIQKLNHIFGEKEKIDLYYVEEIGTSREGEKTIIDYFAVIDENQEIFPLKYHKPSDESVGKYLIRRALRLNNITWISEKPITTSTYKGIRYILKK